MVDGGILVGMLVDFNAKLMADGKWKMLTLTVAYRDGRELTLPVSRWRYA